VSAIPPNWLSSIIQSSGAPTPASEARRREAAGQVERTSGPDFAQDLLNMIENDDRDSATFTDAEGRGSLGRPSAPEEDEESAAPSDVHDEPGQLDVQA
jgi:hypothetical protein